MPYAIPTIDPAPALPSRNDRPTFAIKTENWGAWEKAAYPQVKAVADAVKMNADEVYANAQSAAGSAAAAAAVAAASLFSAATVYDPGQAAISGVNLLAYRRRSAGSSATDPSADSVNWLPASLTPVTIVRTAVNFTASANILYIITANGVEMTMPATSTSADLVYYRMGPGVSRMKLKGNGRKIEGQPVGTDITVSSLGYRGKLGYDITDGWMHFN